MYDALVIGVGAMGSAALYHLAMRGCRVIGVDMFVPPHGLGSTHGRTRIIREAYYEHPSYVPLVRKAYVNWDILAERHGAPLFLKTGAMMIGQPGCELVEGTLASARAHDIDVELLSAVQVSSRFPAFRLASDMVTVLEQNAGVLDPEACVRAYIDQALRAGAELRVNSHVSDIAQTNGGVEACTNAGTIRAKHVVLCGGPWNSALLAMLGVAMPLTVERQTMHWFDSPDNAQVLSPERFPVAMIEYERGRFFYAVPDVGDGVKAAVHHDGPTVEPAAVSRKVSHLDTQPVELLAGRFIPAAGRIRESVVCLYTNTPSRDFIIDELAEVPEVILVSACSGHGFKFASAIGEVACDLALGERPQVDISRFRRMRTA